MPCGSRAGIMYGLPKIHKEGAPVRPIISGIGTYNYKLAKYLDRILKPLTTNSNYIIKDTFDFVNRVSKIQTNVNQRVVSFDVESLFTNIPTEEKINIILNRAFKDSDEFHGMKRSTLQKLLTICTQESHFKFNGKYYDQTDGVAMGSPLGPLFANIFMDEFENSQMEWISHIWKTHIWKICQDQTERDLEFKKLKLTLAKNEYPDQIINKEMDNFIKNRTIREQQTHASEQPIAQKTIYI